MTEAELFLALAKLLLIKSMATNAPSSEHVPSLPEASTESGNKERWLIIDNDAGIDDAAAMVLAGSLAKSYGVVIKALVVSYGNVGREHVLRNNAKIRQHMGPDGISIPILPGHDKPLVATAGHASFWHGLDGLGDAKGIPQGPFPLPHDGPVEGGSQDMIARVTEIAEEAASKGHELIYCVLGPMTNLASAVRVNPKLKSLIKRLVVMGGCGNARGNDSLTGEFNVLTDPEAASIVFATFDNVEVVSWELTLVHSVPWPIFDKWRSLAPQHPAIDFLDKVLHLAYVERRVVHTDSYKYNGAIICDALAIAYVLEPKLAKKSKSVWVGVELEGTLTRGQTVVDWGTSQQAGKHGDKNCTWVIDIDQTVWEEMFARIGVGESSSSKPSSE